MTGSRSGLEGKVAVIAGVGPGLGRDVAAAFLREGASVALLARTKSRLDTLTSELEAGERALAVTADIARPADNAHAVAAALDRFGTIDCLVNVAYSQSSFTTLADASPDLAEWRPQFESNLFAVLQMTRALVPHFAEQGEGSIVMVNTIGSRGGNPRYGDYEGAKGALASITRTLAAELGPSGIRVNAVHPGHMWGDWLESYFHRLASEKGTTYQQEYDAVANKAAMRRIATTSDVAEVVAFLASSRALGITGQEIHVNAGEYFH